MHRITFFCYIINVFDANYITLARKILVLPDHDGAIRIIRKSLAASAYDAVVG